MRQFQPLFPSTRKLIFTLFFLLIKVNAYSADAATSLNEASLAKPKIQLATIYKIPADLGDYYVSEKLDGVRGHWTGTQLLTRKGNIIKTPAFFTRHWPKMALDGEIWLGRNTFEQVSSLVRTAIPQESNWQKVRFMIFDLPQHQGTFSQRIEAMKIIVNTTKNPALDMITQQKVASQLILQTQLNKIITDGGEGLMLHHQNAYYQTGRNSQVMKLKHYQDAEAQVLAHNPGKGKYTNKLGSLLVKTTEGIVFKIGTGFSDQERSAPPPVGSIITFKYTGKTKNGVPKFASYMRQRY